MEIIKKPGSTCKCKMLDDPEAEKTIVIFKYRLHDWLVGKNMKEKGSCEESDLAGAGIVVMEEIAASLAKRKSREEEDTESSTSSSQPQRIRVSLQLICRVPIAEALPCIYRSNKSCMTS